MELAIPLLALGGLYVASKSENTKKTDEGFQNQEALPNTDVPNKNYPEEYPVESEELEQTQGRGEESESCGTQECQRQRQ